LFAIKIGLSSGLSEIGRVHAFRNSREFLNGKGWKPFAGLALLAS
jgi:hypothetical protein